MNKSIYTGNISLSNQHSCKFFFKVFKIYKDDLYIKLFSLHYTSYKVLFLFLYTVLLCKLVIAHNPSVNCRFDELSNVRDSGFCTWRPATAVGTEIWHTGNAVIVDSSNFVISSVKKLNNSNSAKNRFAYVQGKFGSSSEGSLESIIISDNIKHLKELKLLYWKVLPLPTLDICIKNTFHDSLNCIDSITGPGQHQWVRRSINLPPSELPFKVCLFYFINYNNLVVLNKYVHIIKYYKK